MASSSAAALRSRPEQTAGAERRAVPTPLTVEWLRSLARIESLAEEWSVLEAAVQDRTVFSTFDYLVTWYRNYAGEYGGDPLVGIARRGSQLVGVAPLVVCAGRVGRVPVTRVHFAVHEAYAGEFLVEDDHPETIAAFLDSLVGAVKFDLICLNGVDPASDRFHLLAEAAGRHRLAIELTDHPNAFVDLRSGYEQYCSAMSRNFRRTVKRQAQRVASAGRPTVEGVHLTQGLETLVRAAEPLGEVFVVAPDREQSATSHSLTLHHPVRPVARGDRPSGQVTPRSVAVARSG